MNQITITGNLTRDPEQRYTASGVPVTGFDVAVNEKWKAQDGTQQEKVVFFRVSAWRNLSDPCANFLHKGSKVLVVGKMEPARAFQKQDGTLGASLDITAANVEFLTSPNTSERSADPMSTVPTPPAPQPEQEDIPW